MIGEEVARQADSVGRDAKCTAEEIHEDPNHLRVRVREHELVSVPRPLGPIKHAPHDVKVVGAPGAKTAVMLCLDPASPRLSAHRGIGKPLSLVETVSRLQSRVLFGGQFDVTYP